MGKCCTKKQFLKMAHELASGNMTISEFLNTYTYSVETVLDYAKKDPSFTSAELNRLTRHYRNSVFYQEPFNREFYKEHCSIMVGNKLVKPTDKEIDACIAYLRENDFYECDFTVRSLIGFYLQKKIDLKKEESKEEFSKALEELELKKLKSKKRF